MSENQYSRRRLLEGIGALSTTAAGCLDLTSDDSETRTRTPLTSSSTRETDSTPTTQTSTASPTPSALDQRRYALFSPHPDKIGLYEDEYFWRSRRVADAAEIDGVFEEREPPILPTLSESDMELVVWAGPCLGVVADYDQSELINAYRHRYREELETYRGYTLLDDNSDESWRHSVAIGESTTLTAPSTDREKTVQTLKHLVDVRTGNVQPYFLANPDRRAVVEHLPQGLFIRFKHSPDILGRLRDRGVLVSGHTVFVPSDPANAASRTVLQFDDQVPDSAAAAEAILEDETILIYLRTNDPEVVKAPGNTAVIEDTINIEGWS